MSDTDAASRKHERKMLLWFAIALMIALLPWFLLAENPPRKSNNSQKKNELENRTCQKACAGESGII